MNIHILVYKAFLIFILFDYIKRASNIIFIIDISLEK